MVLESVLHELHLILSDHVSVLEDDLKPLRIHMEGAIFEMREKPVESGQRTVEYPEVGLPIHPGILAQLFRISKLNSGNSGIRRMVFHIRVLLWFSSAMRLRFLTSINGNCRASMVELFMGDGKVDSGLQTEIRRKVTRCREVLLRNEATQVDELARVCAEVLTIPEKNLPNHLWFALAKARESLFGDALTAESDAEIAEEQLRKTLHGLSFAERMHFAQLLIAFCDQFEDGR